MATDEMKDNRFVSSTIYNQDFYLKMEGGNESFVRGLIEDRFGEAFILGGIKRGMAVLDLGTGRGEIAVLCAQANAQVTAVDYSFDSINMAKKFASETLKPEFLKNINFQVMNAKDLPLSDNSFDRVFFLEILEHLYPEELAVVLPKIRKLLKDDGKLILSTGPNALLIKPMIWLGSLVTGRKAWASREYHVNEQTYWQLKNLLATYGFSLITMKIGHSKNWLYGQIVGQTVSPLVKTIAKIINMLFDSYLFYIFRRLPLIDRFLGTHFICLCTPEGPHSSESSYDQLHREAGFGEEEEYYQVIGLLLKGKKAVDIGCGYGGVEKYAPETVAVDFSEEALKVARQKGAKYTVKAAAENLPFKDNEFEVALSLGVLEHCEDQAKAVAEMVRVSEVQILVVHAKLPYGLEIIRQPLLSLFGLKDQPVEKPLSLDEVKRLLRAAGARTIVEGVWNWVDLRWLWKKIPYGLVKWPSHHFLIAVKTAHQERRFLGDGPS